MTRRHIDTIEDVLWRKLVSNFRDNVLFYRHEKKWSQEELARRAQVSTSLVAEIEQGKKSNPRMESIAALTKAFGINDYLGLLKNRRG